MNSLPNHHNALLAARLEFQETVRCSAAYTRQHRIDLASLAAFNGGWGLAPIADHGNGRFDFTDSDAIPAFVIEAYGPDGETVVDVVGWPLDQPDKLMSMFGRCGLLGAWQALGPATYFMGGTLALHRTPLDWLRSGCKGAAIVTPSIAAAQLAEAPGQIAAHDHAHGRQLVALLRTVLHPENKIVVPSTKAQRNAA